MPAEFLRVECEECGNEQKIFSRAATPVECLVCGEKIAESTGGLAKVRGKVKENLSPE